MLSIIVNTVLITSNGFVVPALASSLTIEDRLSLQDPLQDRVTICHFPDGNLTGANNITVGEDLVPDHLAHGGYDWLL